MSLWATTVASGESKKFLVFLKSLSSKSTLFFLNYGRRKGGDITLNIFILSDVFYSSRLFQNYSRLSLHLFQTCLQLLFHKYTKILSYSSKLLRNGLFPHFLWVREKEIHPHTSSKFFWCILLFKALLQLFKTVSKAFSDLTKNIFLNFTAGWSF